MSHPVPVTNHGLFPLLLPGLWCDKCSDLHNMWGHTVQCPIPVHVIDWCEMYMLVCRCAVAFCLFFFSGYTCVYILQDLFWLLHVGLIKLVSVSCSPDHHNRDWHQRRLIWRLSLSHLAKFSTLVVEKPMWRQNVHKACNEFIIQAQFLINFCCKKIKDWNKSCCCFFSPPHCKGHAMCHCSICELGSWMVCTLRGVCITC